jgi:hypothetical protein
MREEPAWAGGFSLKTEAQWMMSFIGASAMIIETRCAHGALFSIEDIDAAPGPRPRGSPRSISARGTEQERSSLLINPGT